MRDDNPSGGSARRVSDALLFRTEPQGYYSTTAGKMQALMCSLGSDLDRRIIPYSLTSDRRCAIVGVHRQRFNMSTWKLTASQIVEQ